MNGINLQVPESLFEEAGKLFSSVEIEYYIWMPTLLLSPEEGQSYGLTRSDFAVNLLGTNCYDNYIFVPHYRFLCPTSPKVISFAINKFSNACL